MSRTLSEQLTFLCVSAASGDVLGMQQAVIGGFNADQGDYDDRTALHVAASKGQTMSVSYLLDHKANPNAVDCFGNTPLFEAVRNGHRMVAQMLRKAGANLGLPSVDEPASTKGSVRQVSAGSLVCQCASENNVRLLTDLLDNGLSPNAADYDNRSGLHVAVACGHLPIVKLLVSYGATVDCVDNFGSTPLLGTVRVKSEVNLAILKLLICAGANVNVIDLEGNTPLFLAVDAGNYIASGVLRDAGGKLGVVQSRPKAPTEPADPVAGGMAKDAGTLICKAREWTDESTRAALVVALTTVDASALEAPGV